MNSTQDIPDYVEAHREEAFALLTELAQIPAPSNHEEKRAEFCRAWLKWQGADDVYIDEALNVVYPVGCDGDKPITVYMAHSDVVFPDLKPLPLRIDKNRLFCPGVGDDTANVVALLTAAKYVIEKKLLPRNEGVLFVINAGEEGLGNLKGSRAIIERYGSRIKEFITFDGYAKNVTFRAVGSARYRVEIETEGGHSFGKFGNRNAIACLASLIDTLYQIKVPTGGKTTYNVGTISGGTSVNTIAQHAEMLYEYRSDVPEHLETMEQSFRAAIEGCRANGLDVRVTLLGKRPCGIAIDETAQSALVSRAEKAVSRYFNLIPSHTSGSTDCNIPLSIGIPSVCVGCVSGGGAHTREEYVEIDSLAPGLCTALELILSHF